jgi:hypothetical protein
MCIQEACDHIKPSLDCMMNLREALNHLLSLIAGVQVTRPHTQIKLALQGTRRSPILGEYQELTYKC